MRSNFDACAAFTRGAEGGLVWKKEDPGGITNMGITLATLRHWRGSELVGPSAVRDLRWPEAEAIYGARYWNPVRGDDLPLGVDLVVFDFGVNAGPRRSAEQLQEVLGMTVDGWVGPETLGASDEADAAALIAALTDEHETYYARLPSYRTFGRGWDSRAERCRAAALAMLGPVS